jgi:predicted Ser/Thr protein kinase
VKKTVPIGQMLGSFQVVAKLGEGGMGEVYRARDTKLNRNVAIKVLPEAFALDADRLARFTREAQVLASLNHPNIAGIYGIEGNAIVMELVEGQDLSEIISAWAQAPALHLSDAIAIARQIADALEAAHEQGIIHRDLKPQNIKVRDDGTVKVLDFGLAKALDRTLDAGPGTLDPQNSPTLTARATQMGMILGTAAYMSPEQARGKVVDRRADIWAFGVVLFEMLSGRQCFNGEDISVTLANVIKEHPKWDALPADVPASIRRLLRRCLEKDPKRRLGAISDARLELDELDAPVPPMATAPPPRPSKWIAIAAVASTLAVVFAVVTFVTLSNRQDQASVDGRVQIPVFVPDGVSPGGVAVSPDGRHVAFGAVGASGRPNIWMRSLDAIDAHPLPGGEGGSFPFWSPDGRSLGFLSNDGKLRRLGLAGGAPLVLADAGQAGGSWGTSGVILFGDGRRLLSIPASGGLSSEVAVDDRAGKDAYRGLPQFLKDGRRFLYAVKASGVADSRFELRVGSIDAPATTLIQGVTALPVALSGSGDLLFLRGSILMAQQFDEERLALVGQARPVTPDAVPATLRARPSFSTSSNGVLAFVTTRLGSDGQLAWFDRSGKMLGAIPQAPDDENLNPSLSPDGTRLAVNRIDSAGNWDIWVIDLESQIASRLTSDPDQDSDATWSPDGHEIAFVSDRGGEWGIYRKDLRNAGGEQLIVKTAEESRLSDWTRDGFVVYSVNGDLSALPVAGRTRTPITIAGTPFFEHAGKVSPDGKWIAYQSSETGGGEIYIQPFPGPGAKKLVSNGRGLHPMWRAGGRELIYWGNDHRLMSVDLRYDGAGVHASTPQFLLPPAIRVLPLIDARTHYTVTPDGQRFLIRQPVGPPGPPMNIILNWAARLPK